MIARGQVAIHIGSEVTLLGEGDAILFVADVEHTYENRGDSSAILYLVMAYTHEIGR